MRSPPNAQCSSRRNADLPLQERDLPCSVSTVTCSAPAIFRRLRSLPFRTPEAGSVSIEEPNGSPAPCVDRLPIDVPGRDEILQSEADGTEDGDFAISRAARLQPRDDFSDFCVDGFCTQTRAADSPHLNRQVSIVADHNRCAHQFGVHLALPWLIRTQRCDVGARLDHSGEQEWAPRPCRCNDDIRGGNGVLQTPAGRDFEPVASALLSCELFRFALRVVEHRDVRNGPDVPQTRELKHALCPGADYCDVD